jgi:hypothetical protein
MQNNSGPGRVRDVTDQARRPPGIEPSLRPISSARFLNFDPFTLAETAVFYPPGPSRIGL